MYESAPPCECIRIPPHTPRLNSPLSPPSFSLSLSVMKEEGPALVVSYVQSSHLPPNISIDHPTKTYIRGAHISLQSQAIWRANLLSVLRASVNLQPAMLVFIRSLIC